MLYDYKQGVTAQKAREFEKQSKDHPFTLNPYFFQSESHYDK